MRIGRSIRFCARRSTGEHEGRKPGQAFDRLVVLGAVGLDEEVEGLLGILPGLGHTDLLEMSFRFARDALGQLVEHVGGFISPGIFVRRCGPRLGAGPFRLGNETTQPDQQVRRAV